MYYNFCRVHQTLRVTPAMEAGLSDRLWSVEEVLASNRVFQWRTVHVLPDDLSANAQSQLRRRTAVSIAPKPIACRRQKFNAIASTSPALERVSPLQEDRLDSPTRLRITNHGIP